MEVEEKEGISVSWLDYGKESGINMWIYIYISRYVIEIPYKSIISIP